MNMNRRKLFGFLAASPIGVAVAARASAASIQNHTITLAEMPPQGQPVTIPLGYLMDEPYFRNVAPIPTTRRLIYDGDKFVDFDSNEGAAVMNRLLVG